MQERVESDTATPRIRSAADILASAPKIGEETFHVDEWDTDVTVRGIGKREQRKIQDDAIDPESGKTDEDVVEMSMFMNGVLAPKFSEAEIEALWLTSPRPINRVLLKILELSGSLPKTSSVETAVRTFPQEPPAAV